MTVFPENAPGVTPHAAGVLLRPISLLPHGIRFQPHEFADQWLNQWGLIGDTRVQVTYQEVETVDSAAQRKTSWVPLRDAVTRGFLIAHQSRATAEPSAREGWVYPHRSHMSLGFPSLRVNGKGLSADVLQQLHAGIAPGYQGIGQPVITEVDAQGNLLSPREKEQIRQLGHLDANQVKLARLFAALPTFDTVLKRLLVSRIKAKIPERKFRASLLQGIDPDHWYVNYFDVDSLGGRSLTASQCFTDVMLGCLATDTPPTYSRGGVGFYTRPDSVEEVDSVFVSPLDAKIPAIMESVFYIADPVTNDSLKQQFRDDLSAFRHDRNGADAFDTSTTEAALAHLLSRRFLHLFDLYKVDRDPTTPLTQSARTLQDEEDRLLDLITTHPSMADRSRLLRAPIPHVYAVMLDMGAAKPQKWPAAMVIKRTDQSSLFLYSLEGGIQRFRSFQDLVNHVSPTYAGQKRGIRDIASELSESVFAVAADDLLRHQGAALEAVLNASGNETLTLAAYALKAEDALGLPMLSLAGPLAVRRETLVENNRADFYTTATRAEKSNYRSLETQVLEAAYTLAGSDIPTLLQFTRQKIKQYLQHTVHPGVDPDPDKTLVTLSYGKGANPRQSRIASLTELMLDNLRPTQYPNAMREVLAVYLADQDGQRIRHPANGFLITLTGGELARMATHIDAGGRYETLLRKEMNKPDYKAAWQAAYLANMKFKGHEAGLRGDEVFKTTVLDRAFHPPKPKKLIALWLQAVLQSSVAETRALVQGRRVQVYGLVLGGSVGAGGQHGTMGNASSIDGVLVFSDQDGPDIKGTVGVYFPDSPEGDDFHEFSSLGEGVAGLLQQEQWQGYFRSRICTLDPEEIKRTLGQQRGRPLIRGALIPGNLLETLHRAHVNFHSAYGDHRSNSNRDVHRQTAARLVMMSMETFMDLAGILLVPGLQLLKSAIKTGWLMVRTGAVPANLTTLVFVHRVANYGGRGLAGGVSVPVRGQSSFLAVTARQSRGETLAGLPLEDALYRRYAVADTSLLQGLVADAQGFYRPALNNSVTRPVYVRQPDGTVFRVHDHTKLTATEATLVDPATGLSIRSSGVMRSTVARMPNGEWRAIGFGRGGGKRPAPAEPGPSKPKVPAPSPASVSGLIRTPGVWNTQVMELVPAIITRLASWPQNRSLLIIDEITAERSWSVRFTPGEVESVYPMSNHPGQSSTDIVLRRTAQNHYSLVLGDRVEEIPGDGDCFFDAVARGLNEGQAQETFSMQGLRNAAADYVDQHPELNQYMVSRASGVRQALFENAPWLENLLDEEALSDLSRIIYGAPNPYRLFQPTQDYLRLYANSVGRRTLFAAREADLPPEVLQQIGRYLSPRSPEQLMPSSAPYYTRENQTLRQFFQDTLLGPVEDLHLTELLNNEFLRLSQGVIHIMLEYGVRARQLTDHHPRNQLAYVKFDQARHGHLDDNQLEQLLDGAYLVDRDDLAQVKLRFERETGRVIDDDSELMEQYIYYDRAESTRDLLIASLERFPDLLRRANLLLRSAVISSNLDGMLPVNVVARWLRNPALSERRLRVISEYADTRYKEVVRHGDIVIHWMRLFDDSNLQNIVTHQRVLTAFWDYLERPPVKAGEVDQAPVIRLFSAPGQLPSNTRVNILFNTPNLWSSLQRLPRHHAVQIWDDLTGSQFSDSVIQFTLERPGVLRSALDFVLALRGNLRANRIVRELFSVAQSRAQQYLNNFDFPVNRLGHSLLDFVTYLESHMAVPDWAWQYLKRGVTPESLKTFGEMKPKPE